MDVSSTKKLNSQEQHWRLGHIRDNDDRWSFEYEVWQDAATSSGRKQVYRGMFTDDSRGIPTKARALVFSSDSMVYFGVECANLGLLSNLGVGPRLLGIAEHVMRPSDEQHAVIIEEDVGDSLGAILAGEVQTQCKTPILHRLGTKERFIENAKILYDLRVQVHNAHRSGIYHRDLRCENVCLRRFGDRAGDIRATIIDFELGGRQSATAPELKAPLYDTLFKEIPSYIAERSINLEPNPLEVDMGFLAALEFHLTCDDLPLNGEHHSSATIERFLRFLEEGVDYYAYIPGALHPRARHLETSIDINPLATALGLTPVDGGEFASPQLLARARSYHKPYLDGLDLSECMDSVEARLSSKLDDIARAVYETYKETKQSQGIGVDFERMEDQPEELQMSCYAQAEHVATKVRILGYLLLPADESGMHEEVLSLTEDQVELLARVEHDRWMEERFALGWKLDRSLTKGDTDAKLSPYLMPYDELDDDVRELDRNAVRDLIPLVKSAGLIVARPA